jgi:hypothetical protein
MLWVVPTTLYVVLGSIPSSGPAFLGPIVVKYMLYVSKVYVVAGSVTYTCSVIQSSSNIPRSLLHAILFLVNNSLRDSILRPVDGVGWIT